MNSPLLGMKLFASFLAFGLTASTVRVVNFDNAPVGQTPPGWTVTMTNRGIAPQWEVRTDRTAPTQPYVLAQLSADSAGDRYPLAIWNGAVLQDGEVSVRISSPQLRERLSSSKFSAAPTAGSAWRRAQVR